VPLHVRLPVVLVNAVVAFASACTTLGATGNRGASWHASNCVRAIEARDYGTAELQCKLCLEFEERTPECLNGMGVVAYARGDDATASSYFNHAVRENNDFAQARSNLGVIAFDDRRYDEAIHHFESAIEIDPHYVAGRYNLALAWLRVGTARAIDGADDTARVNTAAEDAYAKSDEQYRLLLQIAPNHAQAWGDRGVIASWRAQHTAKTGDEQRALLEEAAHDWRRCLALQPDNRDCRGNLDSLASF
jgi:tetratricopeptide (TPR) repeat protein